MIDFILYITKINLLAAFFICLVCIISKIVKYKYSSWWKYYIWLMISLFLVLPLGLFHKAEVVNIKIPVEQRASEKEADTNAPLNLPAESGKTGSVINESPVRSEETVVKKTRLSEMPLSELVRLILYIWGTGVGILILVRMMNYYFALRALRRWAISWDDPSFQKIYSEICADQKLKRVPRIMVNSKLHSPALSGFVNPIIYIPAVQYSESEMKLIIRHELIHYKNRDLWYKLFLFIVNTIYWFNPFLYLMRKEADNDIEYICDSQVIKTCSREDSTTYHCLLLKAAENGKQIHFLAAGLNDGISGFKNRITYMMRANTLKRGSILAVVFVLLLVVSNSLVGCSAEKAKENIKASAPRTEGKSKTDSAGMTGEKPKPEEPQDLADTTVPAPPAEKEADGMEQTKVITDDSSAEEDKSGDYVGNIPSPNPPQDSTYRVSNQDNSDYLVMHVNNLDSANIKFYLTVATLKEGVVSDYTPDLYTESIVFREHTAHYNKEGYYEYIGENYHLYLKYDAGANRNVGDHKITVYGLENLVDQNQYQLPEEETLYYNGIRGIKLIMGLPFAG